MTKNKRFLCVLLAVCVAFSVLTSVFYIANETDHDCTGAFCSICSNLALCTSILNSVGCALVAVFFAALSIRSSLLIFSHAKKACRNISLYSLKVKLSD